MSKRRTLLLLVLGLGGCADGGERSDVVYQSRELVVAAMALTEDHVVWIGPEIESWGLWSVDKNGGEPSELHYVGVDNPAEVAFHDRALYVLNNAAGDSAIWRIPTVGGPSKIASGRSLRSIAVEPEEVFAVAATPDPVRSDIVSFSLTDGEARTLGVARAPARQVRANPDAVYWIDQSKVDDFQLGRFISRTSTAAVETIFVASRDLRTLAADADHFYWTTSQQIFSMRWGDASPTTLYEGEVASLSQAWKGYLYFFSDGGLRRVSAGGGPSELLAHSTLPRALAVDDSGAYWVDLGPVISETVDTDGLYVYDAAIRRVKFTGGLLAIH